MGKISGAAHAGAVERRLAASTGIGPASVAEFFWCFSALGLSGFGGVTPWARRMLVDRKKWLSDAEFAELLGLGQILPGSNISNLAIILGREYFGWRGAVSAICGLHMFPLCIIVALGLGYRAYGQQAWVQHLLGGVLPVAAGMVIATGVKLMLSLPRTLHGGAFIALTFVAAALFQFSLPSILLILAPLAVAATWRRP